MKVRFIGESCKILENGQWYDIDYSINPYYIWVNIDEVYQKTYHTLTDFLLDWDLVDRNRLVKSADFYSVMMKLP